MSDKLGTTHQAIEYLITFCQNQVKINEILEKRIKVLESRELPAYRKPDPKPIRDILAEYELKLAELENKLNDPLKTASQYNKLMWEITQVEKQIWILKLPKENIHLL